MAYDKPDAAPSSGAPGHRTEWAPRTAAVIRDLIDKLNAASDGDLIAADADSELKTVGSAAYRSNDTPIHLPAEVFGAVFGSPSYTTVSVRSKGWSFPDSGDHRIETRFHLPTTWTAVRVLLDLVKPTTNSGDVRMLATGRAEPDGTDLSDAHQTLAATTHTPGAQWVRKRLVQVASTEMFTGGGENSIVITRQPTSASDTLAGAIVVRAVVLERV